MPTSCERSRVVIRIASSVSTTTRSFTPTSATYQGQLCAGVQIVLTDRASLDAPELGIEIAAALHQLYPAQYKLDAIDTLVRSRSTLQALKDGEDPRRIAESWQDAITRFLTQRQPFLLY